MIFQGKIRESFWGEIMRPERLIYTFVSYASHRDTSWGHGSPDEGVDLTAKVAHKYGIPVTWIVNSGSIQVLGERIRKWHALYGDDVILHCPMDEHNIKNRKIELKQAFEREWKILKEAFPWAETKVCAQGGITNDLIEVLEGLEYKGLWGYCWEQIWWDGISHRGIPWGFWYIDSDRYKIPHPGQGKIVACEWTARDLNLSYHTGSPCIYSTDPNDVLRAGLCTGENIEYWKKLFADYLHNTENNEYVFFVQQQEAHEMEVSDAFAVYPMSDVEECAKMLDNFFKYMSGYAITYTTLPKAIELYHEKNQYTAPCYMLTNDSPIRPEINAYTMTLGGIGLGPWPETFFYYDTQCQMAFIKGECKPRMLRNYIGKWNMEDEFKENIPSVFVTKYNKSENLIEIEYEIGYHNPIPFGLVYWDDLTGFQVKACKGASEVKIIQDKLVFLRFNLTGEKKSIGIILQKSNSMD